MAAMAVAAGLVALLSALLFPTATVVASISWVLLVRPNAKLMQVSVAGFTVTEVDALVLLAVVAACRIPRKAAVGRDPQSTEGKLRLSDLLPLLAWPVWMVLRGLMPTIGDVNFGSPLVDLRILSAFLLLFPILILATRRGGKVLLNLICYSAYAACCIAVVTWSLLRMNLLEGGSYPLVNIATGAAQDIRPGGEILIPILVILLVFNKAPLLLGSRPLSFGIVIGEILVSQTLSVALAAVAGLSVALIANWRQTSWMKRLVISVVLTASALTVLNGAGPSSGSDADIGSRFSLSQRVGQTSAQYRVAEADALANIYAADPILLAIGTGPGSLVTFSDERIHEVKDLTHNVYNNIILKTGIIGLMLFSGGFLLLIIQQWKNRDKISRSLVGSFAAIGVLSVTVPFASTVTGLTGLLCLGSLAISYRIRIRSAKAGASS